MTQTIQFSCSATGMSDYALMLHGMQDREFKPLRSTLPLLDFWRFAEERFAALPLKPVQSCHLCFEYPVASAHPEDKPSLTDLMIFHPDAIIGIEAKWREDLYSTVKQRLQKGQFEKSRETLYYWLKGIQPYVQNKVELELVHDLPYQLVHRLASVCYTASEASRRQQKPVKAILLYQVFWNQAYDRRTLFKDALNQLARMIQPTEHLEIYFWPVQILKQKLESDGVCVCHHGHQIRKLLIQEPLFDFDVSPLEAISIPELTAHELFEGLTPDPDDWLDEPVESSQKPQDIRIL